MDTLTHGLAGALLARALPPESGTPDPILRRREAWLGFWTAMLPDADALLSPFSAEFYITQHRGLSHSFVMLPLWAVLLGAVAAWRWNGGWRRFALVSGLGVVSHILLDWITSWGTMFFSPLSWNRYSLDWVFILDFVLSGLLTIGIVGMILLARRGDTPSRAGARASLVASCLYIALCAQRHQQALALVDPRGALATAVIPQPLSPDRWLILSDDGKSVSASFVDLSRHGADPRRPLSVDAVQRFSPSLTDIDLLLGRLDLLFRSVDDPRPRIIPKTDGPLAVRTLAESANGIFNRFARFPAARETLRADGTTEVLLRDVRFGYLAPAVDPFTYVVRYDAAGGIVFAGFPSERWGGRK